MKISVIIPIYNNEKTMERCLSAVFNQTRKPDEVIVVDCSSDSTPEIIKGKFPKVKLFHADYRRWPSVQRNIGVKHASGDILAFTDGDVVVENNWIEEIEKAHKDNDIVGGPTRNGNPKEIFGWMSYLMEFSCVVPGTKRAFVSHLPTCNMSYKKRIFDDHRFPEYMEVAEDTLFHYSLIRDNEKILFNPNVIVNHINKHRLFRILAYQSKLGRNAVISRRKCSLIGNQIFVKNKLISPFFAFGKLASVYSRLLRNNLRMFIIAVILAPVIISAHVLWDFAFVREVWK